MCLTVTSEEETTGEKEWKRVSKKRELLDSDEEEDEGRGQGRDPDCVLLLLLSVFGLKTLLFALSFYILRRFLFLPLTCHSRSIRAGNSSNPQEETVSNTG